MKNKISLSIGDEISLINAIEEIKDNLKSKEDIVKKYGIDSILEKGCVKFKVTKDKYVFVNFDFLEDEGLNTIIRIDKIDLGTEEDVFFRDIYKRVFSI